MVEFSFEISTKSSVITIKADGYLSVSYKPCIDENGITLIPSHENMKTGASSTNEKASSQQQTESSGYSTGTSTEDRESSSEMMKSKSIQAVRCTSTPQSRQKVQSLSLNLSEIQKRNNIMYNSSNSESNSINNNQETSASLVIPSLSSEIQLKTPVQSPRRQILLNKTQQNIMDILKTPDVVRYDLNLLNTPQFFKNPPGEKWRKCITPKKTYSKFSPSKYSHENKPPISDVHGNKNWFNEFYHLTGQGLQLSPTTKMKLDNIIANNNASKKQDKKKSKLIVDKKTELSFVENDSFGATVADATNNFAPNDGKNEDIIPEKIFKISKHNDNLFKKPLIRCLPKNLEAMYSQNCTVKRKAPIESSYKKVYDLK